MYKRIQPRVSPPQGKRGFTLIELVVAVAVIGILMALALPSFNDSIRKSRRADAFAALNAVQQAQERWRANRAEYATSAQLTRLPTAAEPGLGLSAESSGRRYAIALSTTGATGYTATATAVPGSSQASDGDCSTLAVRVAGGNVSFGSGGGFPDAPADLTDTTRCWAR